MTRKLFIVALVSFSLVLTGFSCNFKKEVDMTGGVFKSLDGGLTWAQKGFITSTEEETLTLNGYNIRDVALHPSNPSLVFAATNANGLYRSTDDAASWTPTGLDAGQITSVAVDPGNAQVLYATSGRFLYKSSDQGDHWEQLYTDSRSGERLFNVAVDAFDSQRIYISNGSGALFKSYDGGNNWQQIHWFDEPIQLLRLSPADTRHVYAVVGNKEGLFFSSDGGENWESFRDRLRSISRDTLTIHDLAFHPTRPEIIYIGTDYGLLKSEDAGQTWATVKTLINFGAEAIRNVAFNPLNPEQMYHSTAQLVYVSDDGGFTWKALTALPSQRTINQLVIHPTDTDTIYVGLLQENE
ncbi:MAG: YCF48-related protein [bacterium]|nr:YCF48-related protein [bacterium]